MTPEPIIIDGRQGTVLYIDAAFKPVPKDEAKLARVLFGDGGTAWYEVTQPRALAAREGPLHRAADRLAPQIAVAVRLAFAMGRRELKKAPRNTNAAVRAIEKSLAATLPAALRKVYAAGGAVAARKLSVLRAAGGAGSGNFGHAGRPGQVGGSTSNFSTALVEKHGTTLLPEAAAFMLPDGIMVRRNSMHHQALAEKAGTSLQQLEKEGVIRLVTGGAETPGVPTPAQAKLLSDDWNSDRNNTRHFLDVTIEGVTLGSIVFEGRVNSEAIRQFAKRAVAHPKDQPPIHEVRHLKRGDPDPELNFTFDAKREAAISWADRHAAEAITNISETSREAINNAVAEYLETGDFDAEYDAILEAVGSEERADLIARNESMVAVHEGQREAWDQAVDEGLLTGNEERGWIVVGDEKVCPICEGLEGKRAKLGGVYSSDGEEYEGPPAHVGCRCSEGIVG